MKQVAIVTGLAGGIGRESARLLAQKGYTVVGMGRRPDPDLSDLEGLDITYLPGDIVYIKHQPTVRDGQVAVVLIDDRATLKHVYRDPDGLTLISDNPDYERIVVKGADHDYIAIYGVPVGYTRMYKADPLKKLKKGMK